MKELMLLLVILMLVLLLGSCGLGLYNPPSLDETESWFMEYRKEIGIINDYLLELDNKDVIVTDRIGSMIIGLDHQRIEDDTVRKAVRTLWESGCICIFKEKEANAVSYQTFHSYIGDAVGGIAYAIDSERQPIIQYLTEMIPLSEDGWYYYLSEYERWRVEHES